MSDPDWVREPPEDLYPDEPPAPADPTPPPSTHTVERGLAYLAGRCDGAVQDDGQGFNAYDSPFGHSLAELVDAGLPLSDKQRRAGYRLIRKYRGQLSGGGIDFDKISDPTDTPTPAPQQATTRGGFATKAQSGARAVVKLIGKDNRILVTTPYALKDVVKAIPQARWDKVRKCWHYPATPTQANAVTEALAVHGLTADDAFKELLEQHNQLAASRVHRDAEDLPDVPVCNLSAWNHQRQAFWFAKNLPGAMLAMDMGTGKSRVAVDLFQNYDPASLGSSPEDTARKAVASGAQRILIVCPPKVLGVWPREFRKHQNPDRPWHVVNGTYEITRGKRKGKHAVYGVAERVRMFEEALYDCRCGRPHAVVANYEMLAHEPMKSWVPEKIDYFVMDEIHKIKSPGGVWSRWCARVAKVVDRRLGLTGTPMPQSPLDVFAQYRALDSAIFGTTKTGFEHHYAEKGGYGGYEILGLKNEGELHDKFHSIAYMVGAEVLDLPPVLPDITLSCELGKDGAKVYDAVAGEMYAAWDAGEITAANVLVKMLRLQQITGGAVNTDEGVTVEIDTSKSKLLADTLDDIGFVGGAEAVADAMLKGEPMPDWEPIVVFCRFIHDLDVVKRVAEATGRRYAEISGRDSDGLTADATMNPDCDIVGVQIQSGGTGVDLTRAAYGIYYSLGFSLGDYLQSRKRLDRPGQERSVRFLHLVVQDSIDEDVYAALEAREEVVDFVLKHAGVDEVPDLSDADVAEALSAMFAGSGEEGSWGD